MAFRVGSGQIIPGLDSAILGMAVGEKKKVCVSPADAYGQFDPKLLQTVPRASFPEGFELTVDSMVQGQNAMGQSVTAKIKEVNEDTAVLDFNHPLAGRNLNFEVELLSAELV